MFTTLPEIAAALSIENKDIGSAFGMLSKEGVLKMNAEKRAEYTGSALPSRIAITAELLKKAAGTENGLLDNADLSAEEQSAMVGLAKKRGATDSPFKIIERETVTYKLTADACRRNSNVISSERTVFPFASGKHFWSYFADFVSCNTGFF